MFDFFFFFNFVPPLFGVLETLVIRLVIDVQQFRNQSYEGNENISFLQFTNNMFPLRKDLFLSVFSKSPKLMRLNFER